MTDQRYGIMIDRVSEQPGLDAQIHVLASPGQHIGIEAMQPDVETPGHGDDTAYEIRRLVNNAMVIQSG
jgi:hypothetical protein